jgi:hypothetical protein
LQQQQQRHRQQQKQKQKQQQQQPARQETGEGASPGSRALRMRLNHLMATPPRPPQSRHHAVKGHLSATSVHWGTPNKRTRRPSHEKKARRPSFELTALGGLDEDELDAAMSFV